MRLAVGSWVNLWNILFFFNFSWCWISVAWRVINQLRSLRIYQPEDDPISYQIYLHYKSRGKVKIKVEQRTVKRPACDLGVEQWPWGLTRTKWNWSQTWKVRKHHAPAPERSLLCAKFHSNCAKLHLLCRQETSTKPIFRLCNKKRLTKMSLMRKML